MVLATDVGGVDVHPAIVGPIVGEGHDQLDACIGRSVDDLVEGRHIDRPLALCPSLEDDLGTTSAFSAVLRKSVRVVGDVLFVETPSTEDLQASLDSRGHAEFDIGLVLLLVSMCALN